MKPAALLRNIDYLEKMLDEINRKDWLRVFFGLRRAATYFNDAEAHSFDVERLPGTLSLRTITTIGMRATPALAKSLFKAYFPTELSEDYVVLDFVHRIALDATRFGTNEWKPDLELIERCYKGGSAVERHLRWFHKGEQLSIPLGIAKRITEHPTRYPSYLLAIAEERCTQEVASKVSPVAEVASREHWFDQ